MVNTHVTTPRSFNLKISNGREVRRNRVHIRKRNDNVAEKEPIEDGFSETRMYNETTLPNSSQPDQSQEYRTRSGRISKPPERWQAGT